MAMRKTALCVLMAGLMTGSMGGCSRENGEPKAEASVKVDLDKTKDSLENAADKVESEVKKGAKEAKAKLEDAGDAIKDKLETAKDKLSDDKKAEVKIEVKKD